MPYFPQTAKPLEPRFEFWSLCRPDKVLGLDARYGIGERQLTGNTLRHFAVL